jgi:hypothetical protein
MNKTKTAELTGAALDWAVAKCEGYLWAAPDGELLGSAVGLNYSTNWAQGGPIIEREGVSVVLCAGDLGEQRSYWVATIEQQCWEWSYGPYHEQDEDKSIRISYKSELITGSTPLEAAMRCFVASKLGDTVDIPAELLTN